MHADEREVRETFLAALQLNPGAEREDYLVQACGDKPEMRQQVEALLAARALAQDEAPPDHDEQSTELRYDQQFEAAAGEFDDTVIPGSHSQSPSYAAADSRSDTAPLETSGTLVRYLGDYEIQHVLGQGGIAQWP